MTSRRFPPPWSVQPGAESLIVTDADGRALAFVYAETERGAMSAKPVPSDAEALASAIAALPCLMGAGDAGPATVTLPASAPAPWAVLERPGAFAVVADNGTMIAWVYVAHPRAGHLTHDEARRIASGIARLPELA